MESSAEVFVFLVPFRWVAQVCLYRTGFIPVGLLQLFRFGDTSLQESINQENLELLKEYYKLFTEKMPPDCE